MCHPTYFHFYVIVTDVTNPLLHFEYLLLICSACPTLHWNTSSFLSPLVRVCSIYLIWLIFPWILLVVLWILTNYLMTNSSAQPFLALSLWTMPSSRATPMDESFFTKYSFLLAEPSFSFVDHNHPHLLQCLIHFLYHHVHSLQYQHLHSQHLHCIHLCHWVYDVIIQLFVCFHLHSFVS